MIKVSKNIQIPDYAKKWISKNIFKIKSLIEKKYSESKQNNFFNSIILPEKLILDRPHDDETIVVRIIIAPEELFYSENWVDEGGPFYGWADNSRNAIYLNSNKLNNTSAKMLEFIIMHEIVHIIDPKLYREDLSVGLDKPYYERPHEIDAFLTEMSEILRYKYPANDLLDMLRSGGIGRLPHQHHALKNLSQDNLRRFKVNLYHDIISDIESGKDD